MQINMFEYVGERNNSGNGWVMVGKNKIYFSGDLLFIKEIIYYGLCLKLCFYLYLLPYGFGIQNIRAYLKHAYVYNLKLRAKRNVYICLICVYS